MLPPFIIEQIRQREEQKRRDDRPMLELPLDDFGSRGGHGPRGRQGRHGPHGRGRQGQGGYGGDGYGEGYDPERPEQEIEPTPEGERGIAIIQF